MNFRGGLALIKATWSTWLQNRSFFFLLAFSWMVPPLIYLFVWSTAAGQQTIGGFSRGDFVAYYLAFIVVNQLTYAQTNWTVGDRIRYGTISPLLLRPMPPLFDALASEIAGKIVYMIFIVPVTLLLSLALRPTFQTSWVELLVFFPTLFLAWMLRFFWGYWLASLTFWTSRSDSLLILQDTLVFLFAGQVAPVAILPPIIKSIALILPFRYMIGFPVEVLIGNLTPTETVQGFFMQFVWTTLAVILFTVTWKKGLKQYASGGG